MLPSFDTHHIYIYIYIAFLSSKNNIIFNKFNKLNFSETRFVGASPRYKYIFVECEKFILERLYPVTCVIPLGIIRTDMTMATQSSHELYIPRVYCSSGEST